MPFGCLIGPESPHSNWIVGRVIVLAANGQRSVSATHRVARAELGDGADFAQQLLMKLAQGGVNTILSELGIEKRLTFESKPLAQ